MGTTNFMFNHHLDVIRNTARSNLDWDAYLDPDLEYGNDLENDPEKLQEIFDDSAFFCSDHIRYLAKTAKTQHHKIDGFKTTLNAYEGDADSYAYYDRNYGGDHLATIKAETDFYGEKIILCLDVVLRHGYYEGYNIDQIFTLENEFSGYSLDHLNTDDDDDILSMVDFVIDEFECYQVASKAQLQRCRKGIRKRIEALEKALWSFYYNLLEGFVDEYRVDARFCNGETWYRRVTKL